MEELLREVGRWRVTLARAVRRRAPELAAGHVDAIVRAALGRWIAERAGGSRESGGSARTWSEGQSERSAVGGAGGSREGAGSRGTGSERQVARAVIGRRDARQAGVDAGESSDVAGLPAAWLDDQVARVCAPAALAGLSAEALGQVHARLLGRARRRAGGVFYTPGPIVAQLVEDTLGRALAGASVATARSLRIVDPACGAGSFLVAAYEYLLAWFEQRIELTAEERRTIALGSIFGVDVDARAVELCRRALERSAGTTIPELAANIRRGNAILGPPDELAIDWERAFPRVFAAGGFSVVLTNPPYVDSERMLKEHPAWRAECARRYRTASGNWDLFCVFIEQGLRLCAPDGLCGMIVPNKLLSADYARAAREILTREHRLLLVRDYAAVPIFAAEVVPIAFVAARARPRAEDVVVVERMAGGDAGRVEVAARREVARVGLAGSRSWALGGEEPWIARVRERGRPLGEFAAVWGAATVAEAYAIAGLIEEGEDGLRVVNSGTIDRHMCLWGQVPMRYLGRSLARPVIPWELAGALPPKRLREARTPKVIVAGMTRELEATLDREGRILAGKSTTIVWWEGRDLRVLVALLCSDLLSVYYQQAFAGVRLERGYLRVGPPQLRALPVFDPLAADPRERSILERISAQVDAGARAELEALVGELYGLSAEERAQVAAAARRARAHGAAARSQLG